MIFLSPFQILHVLSEPNFSILDFWPFKTELDPGVALGAPIAKWDFVSRQFGKVLFEFVCRWRTQTLGIDFSQIKGFEFHKS